MKSINWKWLLRWGLRVLRRLLSVETRDQVWMQVQLGKLSHLGHQFAPLYSDENYYVMDKASWNKVLWVWKFLRLPYTKDYRDCEDYAGILKALVSYVLELNSMAEVWDRDPTRPHALNLVFFANGEWAFLEPQTGEWVHHGVIHNGIIKI